ncbi:unnamed protein product [Rotaria sordida]|uniref:Uncharacterized protein n=1 Tax=Rotaria sordida TaxID=392033 RepID=A0A815USL0_9BILA|nr:unnamed protein product [Rotaria sordida]
MSREESNRTPSQILISDNNDNSNSSNNNHAHASSSWRQFRVNYKFKIIGILGLQNNIESERIVAKLLFQGRQALSSSEKKHITEYLSPTDDFRSEQWRTTTADWFRTFLDEQKTISPITYDQLLTYTADNGLKFLQDNFYLSLTIRLLFDVEDRTKPSFTQIWNTLTTQGLQGIKEYKGYLTSKMNERLFENNRNPLYLALEDYFRQPLIDLFKQNNLNINQSGLIEHALNCVINNGWSGLNDQKIRDELSPNRFKKLIENLPAISDSSSVTYLVIPTTQQQSVHLSSSTEQSVQRNVPEMKPKITSIAKNPSPPITPSSPIE